MMPIFVFIRNVFYSNFLLIALISIEFYRFTASNDAKPLSELDAVDIKKSDVAPAAVDVPKEVQKIKRTKSAWVPCQLLCYKMNMETNVG